MHINRNQVVNKVVQHITPGMYFGEREILEQKTVPCRVTVASKKAILLGFPKEAMEQFFEGKHRKHLEAAAPLVEFPHEEEVRHDTIIQWKAKQIKENAVRDGLHGSFINDGERDAYLEWTVRKHQLRLKPWHHALNARHEGIKKKLKSLSTVKAEPKQGQP